MVAVDKAGNEVTIAHEAIPDFMEAMTMPFTLKDTWALDTIAPGDDIKATLVVDEGRSWIENPVVSKVIKDANGQPVSANDAEPNPGDQVPDFSLVNQDGKKIDLKQYRDKALLLTFIYTRCPLPEYCTLMSTNFASVDKELEKDPSLRDRAHLLSISIDPAYDTPKVLRSYGAAHTEQYNKETFDHWEFATGDPQEVKRVAAFFGLSYFDEKDQIVHALRTALIAPDGRLFKIYRGNEWKPADALSDIRAALGAK